MPKKGSRFPPALAHEWFVCGCDKTGCMFCDGGLSRCKVCGALEGALLSYCPGYPLSMETINACYNGNVVDLLGYRRARLYGQRHDMPYRGPERPVL